MPGEWLWFGLSTVVDTGRFSPGRFFAMNELKAMMAHLVVSYDVKFEQEGVRPLDHGGKLSNFPAPTAQVLFRKRKIMPM